MASPCLAAQGKHRIGRRINRLFGRRPGLGPVSLSALPVEPAFSQQAGYRRFGLNCADNKRLNCGGQQP